MHESRSPAAFFHRANAREAGEASGFPWLGTAESIIPIPASCPHESRSPASFFHRAWHCGIPHPNPPQHPPSKEITLQKTNIKTHIKIIQASPADLDAVTAVEAVCFPAAEAAGRQSFAHRLAAFPESFFLAVHDGQIIGFINGCVTNETTIRDEMYEDSSLHDPEGAYQSIFGLDVLPEYRNCGIAALLMEHMIGDARAKGRKGLILTCKDRLIHYYEKFGYKNMGVSASVHGGAVWYDMLLEFEDQKS